MVRTDARRPARGGDDGFTLIELVVAIAVIAVVMLGLGAVFVATAAGTDAQGSRQVAARIATDGVDRARALTSANLVTGRTQAAATSQWNARPAGVATLLAGLAPAYDPSPAAGVAPNLPTTPTTSTVDRISYAQSFYVAGCQLTTAGACTSSATPGSVPMYDVVVSVGWRDKACPGSACTYQLSTLLAANLNDPLFNSNYKPTGPSVGLDAANIVQDKGEIAAGPTVTVRGGNGAVTLTASGLPAGVTLDPNTGTFTGTLSAVTPTTTVTVTATDRFNLFSSKTFTWTVNPLPTLTSAPLSLAAGTIQTVKLADTLTLTGGTGPFTWSCPDLPLGLTLDAPSGVLTVPKAALGVAAPACTVTDARGKSANATLSLTLLAPLKITAPTGTTTYYRALGGVSGTAVATGCSGVCTWSATGLPTGVTLTSGGAYSGRPAANSTGYTVVFTVRDAAGRTATSSVLWKVY